MQPEPRQILDRDLQRRLLLALAERYPGSVRAEHCVQCCGLGAPDRSFVRNVMYLHEHGLVDVHVGAGNLVFPVSIVSITKVGLDFLQGDGGMSSTAPQPATVPIESHVSMESPASRSDMVSLLRDFEKKLRLSFSRGGW